ncbi:unnamed protein product [[Candida] boidinii]|nr:unnamed protein product [[Candida] boidinii]
MASINKTADGAKSIESLLKKPNGMAIPKPSAAATTATATTTATSVTAPSNVTPTTASSSSNKTTSTVPASVETPEKIKSEPLEDNKDSASASPSSSSNIKKPQYYSRAATGAANTVSESVTPAIKSAPVPTKPSVLPD